MNKKNIHQNVIIAIARDASETFLSFSNPLQHQPEIGGAWDWKFLKYSWRPSDFCFSANLS